MGEQQKLFRVYSIIPKPGKDEHGRPNTFWLNVGTAFPHEDGKGFNLMLQALPIFGEGKLVVREVESEEEGEPKPAKGKGK